MPPKLALLLCTFFVLYAFRYDRKHAVAVSKALWWPTIWYLVVASRFVGYWLLMAGVPLPGGSGDPTEGSVVDRSFFLTLTVVGLVVLARRRFDWGRAFRDNPWLTALIVFMALSVLWSNYPFVSFKRYVKVIGSVVMALVVLTEENPREAFLTVIRRCLYVHLPMSILCVKYFRDIGVSWDWSGGNTMWQGISTSKNVLGQVAMLGVLYFFWEVVRRWRELRWRNLHLLYLLMAVYLLKGSESSFSLTSVSVCLFALVVFLGLQALRRRPALAYRFGMAVFCAVVGLVVLVLVHSVSMFSEDSLFGQIITKFGRDITLTDRTYIWHDCYAAVDNPLLGVGFGGFWIGRMVNIPWNANLTWVLNESHNGYVETYLQLGLIGGLLLAGVLFSTLPKLQASLADDFDFGCFRLTLFLTLLLINITESTYIRGDHHLWLVLMMITWQVPQRQEAEAGQFVVTADDSPGIEQAEKIAS
jgi:O-antigen ligase